MNISTDITFFGQAVTLSCDGRCDKAFGTNWTAVKHGRAPVDPGTYEGECAKPTDKTHNKWCARECERSELKPTPQPLED